MLYYIVPNRDICEFLNRECLKVSYPEPYDEKVRNNIVFIYGPHLLDEETYGWYISFPENTHRPVNWLLKLICKAKGYSYNLSNKDKVKIKNNFSQSRLQNYKRLDNSYPYNSAYDLLNAMLGYWSQFSMLFPDPVKREQVRKMLLENDRVPLYELMPSYAQNMSGAEFFKLKYKKAYLNGLTLDQLQSDRFPLLDYDTSQTIILEREKGLYNSLEDLFSRCGLSTEVQSMLVEQEQEGSLEV